MQPQSACACLSCSGYYGTVPSADLAEEDRAVAWKEASVVKEAVTDTVRERDEALRRLEVLAAEIRAHEDAMRRSVLSTRAADERLYRRLRQVNDARHDEPETEPPVLTAPMVGG